MSEPPGKTHPGVRFWVAGINGPPVTRPLNQPALEVLVTTTTRHGPPPFSIATPWAAAYQCYCPQPLAHRATVARPIKPNILYTEEVRIAAFQAEVMDSRGQRSIVCESESLSHDFAAFFPIINPPFTINRSQKNKASGRKRQRRQQYDVEYSGECVLRYPNPTPNRTRSCSTHLRSPLLPPCRHRAEN
jgi:hypothetical protein